GPSRTPSCRGRGGADRMGPARAGTKRGHDMPPRRRGSSLTQERATLTDLVRRPEFVTDLLQILKSVVAGTTAWWLADHVLGSPLPFLAPWTALLTVHATVHRSLSRGAQSTVASAIGVGISFVIGNFLGVSVW